MPKITLRFSRHRGIGADLICWRDWSDYSHVDLVMPDGRLLGAKRDGVKIRNQDVPERMLDLSVFVTDLQAQTIYALAMAQLGKPYDFAGVIGFAFNRDWQETDKWFCSELIAWLFMQAGVGLLRTDNTSRISPFDLMLSPRLM